MATVLDAKPSPAPKHDARVRAEIGRAVGRIRANDALAGAAALVVLTLGYAVAGVLLDRWLDLPRWVRQLEFAGFLAAFAAVAYRGVVRPLRAAVNPRFAARRIEATSPGAKNAVINWVDLQDRDLSDTVRAAVSVKAAGGLAEADVQKATESRPLVWLGTTAGLLVATLAVLLILCKPAQFFSLLGRTFNPFTTARIASRTAITLSAPAGGDVTVTAGEPLTVSAEITGRLPDPDGPDHVRLQFKHNPDAAEYDELPLAVSAENARDFSLRLPDYVVQNGFRYRVAAGDAVTPEYRVEVRSRPLFRGFEARYEYPAYLRMKPDTGRGPDLDGYRGTVVTLTAKTNREVKSGRLAVAGRPDAVPGKVVGAARDSLEFRITLAESGDYQLRFTSVADEPSDPSPPYRITVAADRPPTVEVTLPKEPNSRLPANGMLSVDGTVGDDFGVDAVSLHARVVPAPNEPPVVLPPKKYRDRSFRREADGSYPTSLEYKDSLPLGGLTDSAGRPVPVKEGSVIEFWLEATDNCTEPKANVGKSPVYRVALDKPAETPAPADRQKNDATRKRDEQQFQQQQDRKLDAERREPPQPPKHADANQQQPAEGQQGGEPGAGQQAAGQGNEPKPAGQQNPGQGTEPKPGNEGTPQANGTPPENPNGQTKDQPGAATEPKAGPKPDKPQPGSPNDPNAEGQPDPSGAKPNDADLQKQADRVQQAINEQNGKPNGTPPNGGAEKPSGQKPPAGDPSQKRPDDKNPGNDQPKPGDDKQTGDPSANPMGASGDKPPAGTKPDGQPSKPGATDPKQPNGPAEKPGPDAGQPSPKPGTDPKDAPKPEQPKPGDAPKPQPGQPGDAGGKPMPPPDGGNPSDPSQPGGPSGPGQPGAEKQPSDGRQQPSGKKPEPGELDRMFERHGEKVPPPKDTVDRLTREADDLASPDPLKREESEKKFDDRLGKEDRERLQQAEKDRRDAANPAKQKKAEEDVDELTKKAAKKERAKDLAKQAGDLASKDDAKREAAEQKFDQEFGEQDRKDLQNAMQDAQSDDPKRQQAGQNKLKEMANKGGGKPDGGNEQKPSAEEMNKLAEAAKDLNSDDTDKRKAAEEKIDRQFGKGAADEMRQTAKDLKSPDPGTRKAAEDKLKDQAKKTAGGQKPQPGEKQPNRAENDAEQKAVKDAEGLASDDPKIKKDAEEKFDKKLGEKGRKELQKAEQDAKSGTGTPEERKAAKDKADQLAKDAAKKPAGDPSQERPETADAARKLAEEAKDLASPDDAMRKAAEEKLDKRMGKDGREKLQQAAKDAQSGDPEKQRAGSEQVAKQTAEQAGKERAAGRPDPKEKSTKDDSDKSAERAQEKLNDLASDDPATREAAEKDVDRAVGKETRERLQEAMKDKKSDNPKTAEEGQRKLDDLAKEAMDKTRPGRADGAGKNPSDDFRPGGAGGTTSPEAKPLDGDERNRVKTAELQLEQFEKNRYNEELKKKLGITDAEYDAFLKAQQERVARMRQEADAPRRPADPPKPAEVPRVRVGESGAANFNPAAATAPTTAGFGTAPPGFADAQRRFAEEAAKQRPKK